MKNEDTSNPIILWLLIFALVFFSIIFILHFIDSETMKSILPFIYVFMIGMGGVLLFVFLQKFVQESDAVSLINEDTIPNEDGIPSDDNRYIPSEVKRTVWIRDGGKCVICKSKRNLEYDHDIPVAKGGSNTANNIRILCKKCNRRKSAKIE